MIGFVADGNEVDMTAGTNPKEHEEALAPGGIIGFHLDYWQVDCA